MDKFKQKMQEKLQKHLGGGEGGSPSAGGTPPFPIHSGDDPKPVYPQPGQGPPGPGQMPPKVANLQYTDHHQFYHPSGKPHDTLRDLGFTGVLKDRLVWTWGDTLMGKEGACMICAQDSASIGSMKEPMASMDVLAPNSNNVKNWMPLNKEEEHGGGYGEYAFGGTNVVEFAPNKGLVYYLKIHRPGGNPKVHGAGVATCEIDSHGNPVAHRPHNTMWHDYEPAWGDVGIVYNSQDRHVYAFGHGASTDQQELASRTFLCKVPADKATDVNAYEYWDNSVKQWTQQRLGNGQDGMLQNKQEQAIFDWHCMNQSAPFWSNYFNKWMLLHGTGWPNSDVICKTADKLEGPWEDHGSVASTGPQGNEEGFRYCATAHPEFDPTGKKVLVTWTRNNVIYGVWIEWQ